MRYYAFSAEGEGPVVVLVSERQLLQLHRDSLLAHDLLMLLPDRFEWLDEYLGEAPYLNRDSVLDTDVSCLDLLVTLTSLDSKRWVELSEEEYRQVVGLMQMAELRAQLYPYTDSPVSLYLDVDGMRYWIPDGLMDRILDLMEPSEGSGIFAHDVRLTRTEEGYVASIPDLGSDLFRAEGGTVEEAILKLESVYQQLTEVFNKHSVPIGGVRHGSS